MRPPDAGPVNLVSDAGAVKHFLAFSEPRVSPAIAQRKQRQPHRGGVLPLEVLRDLPFPALPRQRTVRTVPLGPLLSIESETQKLRRLSGLARLPCAQA